MVYESIPFLGLDETSKTIGCDKRTGLHVFTLITSGSTKLHATQFHQGVIYPSVIESAGLVTSEGCPWWRVWGSDVSVVGRLRAWPPTSYSEPKLSELWILIGATTQRPVELPVRFENW